MGLKIVTLLYIGGALGCVELLGCQDVDGTGESGDGSVAPIRTQSGEYFAMLAIDPWVALGPVGP